MNEPLEAAVERDLWAGGHILRGELPRIPTVLALPAGSVFYAYRMVALVGTPDIVYVCLRNAGGAWDWRVASTG